MKKIIALAAIASIVACVFCYNRKINEGRFNISGTVQVPQRLLKMAQTDNNSCSIIVKNEADVPVAIKRVVNPKFPLEFRLGEENLLVPDIEGNLKLEVQINNHGNLGVLKEGDVFGATEGLLKPNSKNILVQADKMTGMPKVARSVRGNFFRTAAR